MKELMIPDCDKDDCGQTALCQCRNAIEATEVEWAGEHVQIAEIISITMVCMCMQCTLFIWLRHTIIMIMITICMWSGVIHASEMAFPTWTSTSQPDKAMTPMLVAVLFCFHAFNIFSGGMACNSRWKVRIWLTTTVSNKEVVHKYGCRLNDPLWKKDYPYRNYMFCS